MKEKRIGFHLSISKGLKHALYETRDLDCNSMQLFSRNPRSWKKKRFNKDDVEDFKRTRKQLLIFPLVVHSIYLINACSDNIDIYKKSKRLLVEEAKNTELLGGEFLVLHPGSCKFVKSGIKRLASAIDTATKFLSGGKKILIENVAGGGNQIGKNFDELKRILDHVKNPDKIGICIDTCHLFAYGYNFRVEMNTMSMFSELFDTVGIEKINLIHLNDSKFDLGSKRDQHEHLGKGKIGTRGFVNLFKTGFLDNIPIIMETPKDSETADKQNLKKLRNIFKKAKQ